MKTLQLESDGAAYLAGAATGALADLEASLADTPGHRAGIRLHGIPSLSATLSATGEIGKIVAQRMQIGCRPVRALLFDKSPDANWGLGWHQDRTIAVACRADAPGFTGWSVKQGIQHVSPPFDILAAMLTLRVHLDSVPASNAPLLIAPGSHRSLVREPDIPAAVANCGTAECLASRGDVWIYSTPILHASAPAAKPASRRVLQVDYAAGDLPLPLHWLGV